MTNWIKKYFETIIAVSNFVIAIVAIIGLISGIVAYGYYKKANELSFYNIMESSDNKIYDIALENNKPYLLRVMYFSPPENISPRMRANLYFLALFDKDIPIKWRTIPELIGYYHNNLKIIRTNDGQRVTEAILEFERILSICQEVLKYEKDKTLTDSNWKRYVTAYIDDYGGNPYFLAAIHLDHAYGYIDKAFSAYLLDRLKNNPVVKDIYPEMLLPNWLDEYGKGII